MKENNAPAKCKHIDTCVSGLIGSVISIIASVLVWLQKLGCKGCQSEGDTKALTDALERLKQIADQTEIMSDESCKQCCQHYEDNDSRKQVTFSEVEGINKQTQTSMTNVKDSSTQPDPAMVHEKEVQNTADCRCEITQNSSIQIRDENDQCNIGFYEKSVQVDKFEVEPSCDCDVRKLEQAPYCTDTDTTEIAEVYRSLVADEGDEEEQDEECEEEEDEEDIIEYQCPQSCAPYSAQQRPQPQYSRPAPPYDRGQQIPMRPDPRQQSYPRYDPAMYGRQQYVCPPPPTGQAYSAPAGYPHMRPYGYQKPNTYAKPMPMAPSQNMRPCPPPCAPPPQQAPPTQRIPLQKGYSASRQKSPIKSASPVRECVKECPGFAKPPPARDCIKECPGIAKPPQTRQISECLPECAQSQRNKPPSKQSSSDDCTYCTQHCIGRKTSQQKFPQKEECVRECLGGPPKKVGILATPDCKNYCPGNPSHQRPIAMMPKGAIPIIPAGATELDVQKASGASPNPDSYISVENPEK